MKDLPKKCRYCRREGEKLFLKGARCYSPKCPIDKKGAVAPGDHGLSSGRRLSEYAKQLREKQKARRMFGLNEKQFKKYIQKAEQEANTGEELMRLLEIRLDNTLYRLGLVPSRETAKQLINHGHVLVNDHKVTIPSYQVKIGDEIRLSERAQKMNKIKEWLEREEESAKWLQRKGFIGKVKRQPERKEMVSNIDESLIIEFYSR
jgi:small subunit ribosomal protein S4